MPKDFVTLGFFVNISFLTSQKLSNFFKSPAEKFDDIIYGPLLMTLNLGFTRFESVAIFMIQVSGALRVNMEKPIYLTPCLTQKSSS